MKKFIKTITRIIDTIKIKIRRYYFSKTAKIRNKKIINKDFTIISNNCWGGFIYQSYALKYNTPTIGMFLMASDYIKFISNIKHYLSFECFSEVKPHNSKWYNELKDIHNFGKYPIARLDDIELHLLHYTSIEEAQRKWNERKKRINYNNIMYKFSQMNCFTEKDLIAFQKLQLKNKICFISKKYKKHKNEYTFVVSNSFKDIKSNQEPVGKSFKANINEFINKMN